MKIRHRIPDQAFVNNMTGRLSPEYQAEVDKTTERLERLYRIEQKGLEAAERRHERVQNNVAADRTSRARRSRERDIKVAWELVEIRRTELNRLAGLMTHSPAAAKNRGDKSYRKVPITHGGLI